MPEKYSRFSEDAAIGMLVNSMFDDGGDRGAIFPRSDAEDMSHGTRFIPGGVTDARRRGEKVEFITNCGPCCWYWQMPDGSRSYHYDPYEYSLIGRHNHGAEWTQKDGRAGPCPGCGNPFTGGGSVTKEEIAKGEYKEALST